MNKQSTMIKFLYVFIFSFLVFSLVSCELFNGPKDDLYSEINREVNWANAEKLTVRIEYPPAWGTSNPVQGTIYQDIRKGFEFSVDFTPETTFNLRSWQAYLTADLDDLGNWREFPALLTTAIDAKNIQSLGSGDVTLPVPIAAGGTFKFVINTTEPVTIVPWCDNKPRIIRTEPYMVDDSQRFSRTREIVLYFNCALNPASVKFAENQGGQGIWITAKSDNGTITTNKDKKWFYNIEYTVGDGFFMVTIYSAASGSSDSTTTKPEGSGELPVDETMLPENSLITVTVIGIENAQYEPMDEYSFSYKTTNDYNVCFTTWSANYQNGDIYIMYDQKGADLPDTKIYYQVNNGTKIPYKYNSYTHPHLYPVSLDDSGVRKGRSVSGINEYKIFIELYKDKIKESMISFKIWNVPGMVVTHANPLIEVRTEADLKAMQNGLNKQYVLANDVLISDEWTPIGTEANPFEGKFYGNGHTITILNGFDSNAVYAGFFGVVKGEGYESTVRDLKLIFTESGNEPLKADYFGGVAGKIDGQGVIIRNIIIGGHYDLSFNNDKSIIFGGIVGYQNNGAKIFNCLMEADININSFLESENVFFGGAVGKMGTSDENFVEAVNVARGYAFSIEFRSTQIDAGGIIGRSEGGTMRYLHFSKNLSLSPYSDKVYMGGIAGSIYNNSKIENCYSLGDVGAVNSIGGSNYAGGIVGYMDNNTTVQKNFSACEVNAKTYDSKSNSSVYAGGIVGCRAGGVLQNNAALGVLVNAQSDGTKNAGRIYGYPSSSIGSNNYAINTMYVRATYYYDWSPPTTTSSSTDASAPDGKTANISDFRKIDIWIDSDKLAFNLDSSSKITNAWDFSNLSGLGYPKLVGEGQ